MMDEDRGGSRAEKEQWGGAREREQWGEKRAAGRKKSRMKEGVGLGARGEEE